MTYNQHAVGLYSSFGMDYIELIAGMETKADRVACPEPTGLEIIEPARRADLAWINTLEKKVRGYARPPEWRFWQESADYRILIFRRRGRRVGYSMVGTAGDLYPIGVERPADLIPVAAETIRAAVESDTDYLRIFCPNANRDLYRYLRQTGFRNMEMLVFMSDTRYGDFSRYVPASLAVF